MNELSLEKLKIVEKLEAVNTSLAVLTNSHNAINAMIQKHNDMLYGDGNGKKGMAVRMDRLETDFENRRWHVRLIWGAIVGVFFERWK